MSDYQPTFTSEKRNAPIWQVFGVVVVLMALASASFYYGSKNPSSAYSSSEGGGVSSSSDYGSDYANSDNMEDYGSAGDINQVQTYTLESFIGYGSSDVERVIRASGLFVNTRYTNGDPSLNARLNNGCVVVDQNPKPGATVVAGSTIVILADCPLTGQD